MVITRLWILSLVAELKIRTIFQPMKRKTKTNCTLSTPFFPALSKLQVIAMNSDWFIALFPPVVIGQSNYFAIGFSTVI